MIPRRIIRTIALIGLASLSGCQIFNKDKPVDPPAELVDFDAKLKVVKVWSASVGGRRGGIAFWSSDPGRKPEELRLGLVPATDGGRVYAAGYNGRVVAHDVVDGQRYWSIDTDLRLAGGPGVGSGLLVAGSIDGDLVALDTRDGTEQWRINVNAEILAAPAIKDSVVVVRSVNGELRGLAAEDGSEIWLVEETVPSLTLRGTSRPIIENDLAWIGFDNGEVLGVDIGNGDIIWEFAVSEPHGRTQLARLADIDSNVVVDRNQIYTVGFQGRVAAFDLRGGQLVWSREVSSEAGLAIHGSMLYVADSNGAVRAFRRVDGTPQWTQEVLHRRSLTAPVVQQGYVVVGDFEGYLHWLDGETGDIVARTKADGHRITAAPRMIEDTLYVLSDRGKLTAYRVEPR